MRNASSIRWLLYDIIVFENVRFGPSTRKREAFVFKHLHFAIFESVFFLLQWNILVTFAIFAKFATFSRFTLPSFLMIVSFAKVVVFASFLRFLLPSFQNIADKILVTFTNFGTVYNSYWVCYSCSIWYSFYTFLRAVSFKILFC